MRRKKGALCMLCTMALMLSIQTGAFAEPIASANSMQTSVKNVIKEPKGAEGNTGSANTSGPSANDIRTAGNGDKITYPARGSYLDEYMPMYVNVDGGHSSYVYSKPQAKEKYCIGTAFHGSKVNVLAMQDDYSCILYFNEKNQLLTAWIRTYNLSSEFTGKTQYIGSTREYMAYYLGDASVSWSKENFVGSKRQYTLLNEGIENCVQFVLDYHVTARNGSETEECLGPRDVYINDGSGWVFVDQFEYSELGPVHVVVTFDQPTTVLAVATTASCADPNTFVFRQSVLDIYTA